MCYPAGGERGAIDVRASPKRGSRAGQRPLSVPSEIDRAVRACVERCGIAECCLAALDRLSSCLLQCKSASLPTVKSSECSPSSSSSKTTFFGQRPLPVVCPRPFGRAAKPRLGFSGTSVGGGDPAACEAGEADRFLFDPNQFIST